MAIIEKINNKKRIYWLINQYLLEKIDAQTFSDEYYYCFDLELRNLNLTNLEKHIFTELSIVAGRFSDIKEDLEKYPGTYFTEEELRNKIIEVEKILGNP